MMSSASSPRSGEDSRTWDVSHLPPRLLRLIRRPKRLGAHKLWRTLEEAERSAALKSFIELGGENRGKLVRVVAEGRNFRAATVDRWDDTKIVRTLQTLPLPNRLANSLLHVLHLERRREMLAHFLDALDIPNDDGVAKGFSDPDPGEAVVRGAAEDLAREHGIRRVVVYFLTLASPRVTPTVPFADHLWHWMKGLLERAQGVAEAEREIPEKDDADLDEEPESTNDPGRHRSFTTLDRLLIEAVVDSEQDVVGSLGEDEVDDAVDELVSLNGRRQHSFFHAGFRDVLFGRALGEIPARNKTRARWYWAGVILGWARLEAWPAIVAEFDRNAVVLDLGNGADFATDEAARHVAHALRRAGRFSDVANFVQVRALHRSPALFLEVLDIGTELLRVGEDGGAHAIFALLMKAVGALEEEGYPSADPLFLDVRRRHAHCLQRLLRHERARLLLMDLLELDPDPNHLAMVYADLGLLEGRFNRLDDVRLPQQEEELADLLDRLGEGRKYFRKSIEGDVPYAAHGHYCVGVLALGKGKYDEAESHFAEARAQFGSQPKHYADTLANRTDLYFGISRAARARSAGDLTHAARVMVRALEARASFPSYLVDPVVEGLDLGARADLSNFARALLDTHGDAALNALARREAVVDNCPEVADALLRRAVRNGQSEAAATDLRACLAIFLRAGRSADAEDTLDRLESLAVLGIGAAEFEECLSFPEHYQPAWEPEEAAVARARCLEARGELRAAFGLLQPLVHQYATAGDLTNARGVLDRIRTYRLGSDYLDEMEGRVEALADQAMVQEPDSPEGAAKAVAPRARVLFVGGDERQSKKNRAVADKVRQRTPHVEVTFIHPGWSGNWSQDLDRVRAKLPTHDALVLTRFMRTQLGRRIRKHCDRPWRFCWSAGESGMADAILAAAEATWASD